MTKAGQGVTSRFSELLVRFGRSESGATAIEYGLIATLIAVACIASFKALGNSSSGGWANMANRAAANMK